MKRSTFALGCCAFWLLSCGDAGRDRVRVPVTASGEQAREVAIDGGVLRLTRAEVAVGPLYLCATKSAEIELCETALAELLDVRAFDALSQQEQPLGTLDGTSGTIRSGFFDYGISWTLTQQAPRASEGSVDGHSARLVGTLEAEDGANLSFVADVDVTPLSAGDAAVNGLKSLHELDAATSALDIHVDPSRWLRRIQADKLRALDDDGDGKVVLKRGDQPYEAILQGMTANDPPELVWKQD